MSLAVNGCLVALHIARHHPELAQALVLVADNLYAAVASLSLLGLRAPLGKTLRRLCAHPKEALAIYGEVLSARLSLPAWGRRLIIGSPWLRRLGLWPYLFHPARIPASNVALLVDGIGAPGVFPAARAIGASTILAEAPAIRCPMLSIGADHDSVIPRADNARFACEVSEANHVLIEGTGHLIMLERAQALNRRVEQFLSQL